MEDGIKISELTQLATLNGEGEIPIVNNDETKRINVVDLVYPIGSIYMSVNSTNPSAIFGGTWEQIKGRFLLGTGVPDANTDSFFGAMSGTTYNAGVGSTGGQDYHTLTTNEMPSHRHERVRDLLNNQILGETGGNYSNVTGLTYNTGKYIYTDTTHNNVVTDYTGGGQAHNNMPPYFAVYIWKRTA